MVAFTLLGLACGGSPAPGGDDASGQLPQFASPDAPGAEGSSPPEAAMQPRGGSESTSSDEAPAPLGSVSPSGGVGADGDGSADDPAAPIPGPELPSDSAAPPRTAGGDFVVSNDWRGFAYLVADASTRYAPRDFATRAAGQPLCVSGVVAADASYGSFFELGINLNQPAERALPAEVRGSGLALRITRNVPGPLRAQIVGPDGPGDNVRWCAGLSGDAAQHVRWDAFNTACWNGSGTGYDRGPLRSVAIVVPGDAAADTPFDFCVEAFADGEAASDAVLDAPAP